MKHDVSDSPVEEVSKSQALYDRALGMMPGGCSRNTILRKPHPIYAAHAKGCTITDIEGVKRIDFSNNMASLIHGHAHPKVVEAITEQVKKGTAYAVGTYQEIEYAEHLLSRNSDFERIRFANSGTEAVMACLKASRAFTGRPKIAKVEGAYHGLYDYAEVSQCPTPKNWGKEAHPASVPVSHGTPQAALDDVDDISVISSPYRRDGARVGSFGIVGPTRMDYKKYVPLVGFAADVLSDVLDGRLPGRSKGS